VPPKHEGESAECFSEENLKAHYPDLTSEEIPAKCAENGGTWKAPSPTPPQGPTPLPEGGLVQQQQDRDDGKEEITTTGEAKTETDAVYEVEGSIGEDTFLVDAESALEDSAEETSQVGFWRRRRRDRRRRRTRRRNRRRGGLPRPSESDLVCISRHNRQDNDPNHVAHGGYWNNGVVKVKSDFKGFNLWKRHSIRDPEGNSHSYSQANIKSTGHAHGLLYMSQQSSGSWGGYPGGLVFSPFNHALRSKFTHALNQVRGQGGINNCDHDNYHSTPLGRDNGVVFAPGLNQVWIILQRNRGDVYAALVVGAKADDSACVYYPFVLGGDPDRGDSRVGTVMGFSFTYFSSDHNPLTYLGNLNPGTGLPELSMSVHHSGSAAQQIKAVHGICLDASQRNTRGGKVHMWSCDTSNQNQQWVYNSGTGQIKALEGNNKCLDASERNRNGGHVHLWDCDTNNQNQQW
jgi:hypothetical protein